MSPLSFLVQYHNGTVSTKTLLKHHLWVASRTVYHRHLCTHHVDVISHYQGSLSTIIQNQNQNSYTQHVAYSYSCRWEFSLKAIILTGVDKLQHQAHTGYHGCPRILFMKVDRWRSQYAWNKQSKYYSARPMSTFQITQAGLRVFVGIGKCVQNVLSRLNWF